MDKKKTKKNTEQKTFASEHPELVHEWNWEKNGGLGPEDYAPFSNKRVWWKCSEGHEWATAVANRSYGNRCPYCMGVRAIKGKNDFPTKHPDVAAWWDYEKNGDLKPEDYTETCDKKVYWKCPEGHSFQRRIRDQITYKSCSQCKRAKNSLAKVNPQLALEWHPTLNGDLTPGDVAPHSDKKVWWLGKCGHEWREKVASRSKGYKCPYCSGRIMGDQSPTLDITFPRIASEWHPTKNGKLTPKDVTINSSRKAWWMCPEGHEWTSTIQYRTSGHGCPYCNPSGKDPALTKNNSMEVVEDNQDHFLSENEKLCKQIHPTKNGDIDPSSIRLYSRTVLWWKCEKGHEWEAPVFSRVQGNGCPVCTSHKVLEGVNDLATLNPEVAAEWHPTMNGDLKPTQVALKSNRKVWWQCKEGHVWEAVIKNRTSRGQGCPFCAKMR